MEPEDDIQTESEMDPADEMEDWTADLLTIAAGEEAMEKARAKHRDSSPPGDNSRSPEIPASLFKALEHL